MPLRARAGQLWAMNGELQVSLTPWVQGRRAVEHGMTASEWSSFGAVLAHLHAVELPGPAHVPLRVEGYQAAAASDVRGVDALLSSASTAPRPIASVPTTSRWP